MWESTFVVANIDAIVVVVVDDDNQAEQTLNSVCLMTWLANQDKLLQFRPFWFSFQTHGDKNIFLSFLPIFQLEQNEIIFFLEDEMSLIWMFSIEFFYIFFSLSSETLFPKLICSDLSKVFFSIWDCTKKFLPFAFKDKRK